MTSQNGRPRSYRECVEEQLRADAMQGSPQAGLGGGESLTARYLRKSSEMEREAAGDLLKKVRASDDEAALAEIVKDRRGSWPDLLLNMISQNAAFTLGRVVATKINPSVASIPGLAGMAASFFVKAPLSVRMGLQSAGWAWTTGTWVVDTQNKKGKP